MAELRDKQKHRRIQEIIETAATLFRTESFDGTTIEDIAAAAMVAPATVYNYFGSKQGLLRHIVAQHIEERKKTREAFLSDPPSDAKVAVHQFIDLLLDTCLDRLSREMWCQVIAADVIAGKANGEMIGQVTDALLEQFRILFSQLRKRGVMRTNLSVKDIAEASLGIADFHFYRMIGNPACSIAQTKARTKKQLDLLLEGLDPANTGTSATRTRKSQTSAK
jgi:AcrR family transcriptional regulator